MVDHDKPTGPEDDNTSAELEQLVAEARALLKRRGPSFMLSLAASLNGKHRETCLGPGVQRNGSEGPAIEVDRSGRSMLHRL